VPVEPDGDDWVLLSEEPLPIADALEWATVPGCGGLVAFSGTVRDFSEGREGVSSLDYEAYPEQVVERLHALAASARRSWEGVGRIVLWHRVGHLEVRDIAVVVVASTPHRQEAFEVAKYLIDTLKATIPIWKRETWSTGSEWSDGTCAIEEIPALAPAVSLARHDADHGHDHGHGHAEPVGGTTS
jgi:molybdopterin synthase catalytic subunit